MTYKERLHELARLGKIAEEATDAVRYVFKFAGITLATPDLYRVNNLMRKLLTEMEQTREPK